MKDQLQSAKSLSQQQLLAENEKLKAELQAANAQIKKLEEQNQQWENYAAPIMENITSLARLEFDNSVVSDTGNDFLNAIIIGLNMLGEELQSSTVSLDFIDTVFETIGDLTIVVDNKQQVLKVNTALMRLSGFSKTRLETSTLNDMFILPQHPSPCSFENLLESNNTKHVEWMLRTKGQNQIPVDVRASEMRNKEGKVVGAVISASDMREAKSNAAKIKRYQSFFNESLDSMCMIQRNGFFEETNPTFSKVLEWNQEELMAKSFLEFVHPEDRDATQKIILGMFESGGLVSDFQNRCLTKSGKIVPFRWNVVLDAQSGMLFAIAYDMTEINQAQEKLKISESYLRESYLNLQQSNKDLVRINDALDSFVYKVSHDLKSPVINMVSMIQMLQDNLAEGHVTFLATIMDKLSDSCNHFHRIIDDFLDLLRAEKQLQEEVLDDVDFQTVCDDILNNMMGLITVEDVQVTTDFSACKTIYMSQVNLRSILSNLINNGVKYHNRGIERLLEIKSFSEGDYDGFWVKDNGVGIDLENQKHKLFLMFSRLHQELAIDGTGVGLYMVKKIVDHREGKIEVDSAPGVGTTFKIWIPKRPNTE